MPVDNYLVYYLVHHEAEDRHQNNLGLIRAVLGQAGEYMDEARKDAILSAYASRLRRLMELSQRQEREDKLDQDVESNLIRNYSIKGQ